MNGLQGGGGNLRYNPTTGGLEVGGVAITGATEYTLAQFLVLDVADYAGVTVRISDVHTPHNTLGGVLVEANAAGTGWTWIQTPTFTTTTIPTAAAGSGWRVFVSDIGARGSFWYSKGTRWNLDQDAVVLSNITSDIVLTGAPTVYTVAKQVTIPLIDGKSVWGDGDIIELFSDTKKTGTTDIMSQAVHVGATALSANSAESNTLVFPYVASAAGAAVSTHRRILRKSATSVKPMSVLTDPAAGGAVGTGGYTSDVTVTSLDSAASYVSFALKLGAAPVDSALTVGALTVRLISAGAV